jgi:poly(A) polymerase
MCPLSRLYSHSLIQNVARAARELHVPVYLVGGAVRDALRDVDNPHDFDFALAAGFDDLVAGFARENRGRIIPWDVDQKRIVFRQGNARSTVDFSRMHTPDILYDLKQRDFTVNAMALAVHESEPQLIDPLGGQDDLSAHCLRMCSEGAFEADPLRMLRAVRFARQLSCVIESRTRDCMHLNCSLITRSARERIKRELFMILHGPLQQRSLQELHACGLLEKLLPDDVFKGITPEHLRFEQSLLAAGFLEDVLRQPDARLEGVQQQLCEYVNKDFEDGVSMTSLLMFAVLLCNACKPEHATGVGGGDDKLSLKDVRRISSEIGLGRKAQHMLACLVENHMRIQQMTQLASLTERTKVRFVLDCGEAAAGVCLLAIADSLAAGSKPAFQGAPQSVMDVAYDLCAYIFGSQDVHKAAPLLTGDDVISFLGCGAGPRIGDILRQAAQLERDGILQNREAALLWLGNLLHNG